MPLNDIVDRVTAHACGAAFAPWHRTLARRNSGIVTRAFAGQVLSVLSCVVLSLSSGCRSTPEPERPRIGPQPKTSTEAETVSHHESNTTSNATPIDLIVTVEHIPAAGLFARATTKVSGDGTVVFSGYKNVKHKGTIGPEAVNDIWHAIQSADFFSLGDEYVMQASDCPETVITVHANGIRKRVRNRWVGGRSYVVYPDEVEIEKHEALDALASQVELLGETAALIVQGK